MSYLVRRFFLFVAVGLVLFFTAFVSFRCGRSQGMDDAPRHHYTFDVMRSMETSPEFRYYVDSLYKSTYREYIDSVVNDSRFPGFVFNWLKEHPGCEFAVERPHRSSSVDFGRTFFAEH